MLMSVPMVQIFAIMMPTAPTLREVTTVRVTMVTTEMDTFVLVSVLVL